MREQTAGAARDYSRGTPGSRPRSTGRARPSRALLAAAATGALLLLVADLTTVVEVDVGARIVDRVPGHERHGWALALLGLAGLALALPAARGARPAALALLAIGLAAAGVGLIGDLPDVRASGVTGVRFLPARSHPGPGFTLELLGAGLLVAAGAAGLRPQRRREPVPDPDG